MIPMLYDKNGTTKLGDLNDCLECFIEEERNGMFELTLDFPNGYPLADQLLKERIIVVNANDTLLNQKFRIYDTKKFMDETITVFARHISFDLMYDYVNDVTFENQSCEYALNSLFRQSQFSTHYRGYSDIVNAQNYSMSMCNILEAIGGKEGSIIDTYGTGAEILRDNTDIHVLNARGHDNGVTIEYGKNLTGFELDEDTTDLVTRIFPYAKYTPEGGKETLVKGSFVDSPLIDSYSHPYIKHFDYTDKFKDKEIPTKEKLEALARNEYRDNKVDIPKTNFKIEFIPLSKCVGYEELEDKISICDKVTIKNIRYNIDTKAKVIKYKFDVLKDRYESMELGEPRTSLGDIIGNGSGESQVGPQGPPGTPGADGNIEDFPNSLPQTPVLTAKVYGFSTIELSWTYEDKVYYAYELYASKEKDFKPNTFDLIHAGQSSSFLFQAKPNETWYFRVCAKNTHGERTEFSPQVVAITKKIDDLSNYVDNMAIGEALIGELSLDRGWVGKLNANYLDVKGNLSVTNGNGKRTLDIDSFGDVHFMPRTFKILINGKEENIVTESQFIHNQENVNFKFKQSGGYNYFARRNKAVTLTGNNIIYEEGAVGYDKRCKGRQYITNGPSSIRFNDVLLMPGTYSVSFYACSLGNNFPTLNVDINDYFPAKITNNWVTKSWTLCKFENIIVHEVTSAKNFMDISINQSGEFNLVLSHICINEGEIAKDWTPHPTELYDGNTNIDADGITIFNGGLTVLNKNREKVMYADRDGNSMFAGSMRLESANDRSKLAELKPLAKGDDIAMQLNLLGGSLSRFEVLHNNTLVGFFGEGGAHFNNYATFYSLDDGNHLYWQKGYLVPNKNNGVDIGQSNKAIRRVYASTFGRDRNVSSGNDTVLEGRVIFLRPNFNSDGVVLDDWGCLRGAEDGHWTLGGEIFRWKEIFSYNMNVRTSLRSLSPVAARSRTSILNQNYANIDSNTGEVSFDVGETMINLHNENESLKVENKKLKKKQEVQNNEIVSNMLANTEIFEMMLDMTPQNLNNKNGGN